MNFGGSRNPDGQGFAVFGRVTHGDGCRESHSRVADWFAHLVAGPVTRYEWPGLAGFNFVLERALGGGGVASLRYDPGTRGLGNPYRI